MKKLKLVAVVCAILLSGCDEYGVWNTGNNEYYADGALRVSTSARLQERVISLRCFSNTLEGGHSSFDIRYAIQVPLLNRLARELNDAEPVKLVIQVDGVPIAKLDSRAISHEWGSSFLANMSEEILQKISVGRRNLIVMPWKGADKLDSVISVPIGGLADKIEAIRKACEAVEKPIKSPTTSVG